MFEIRGCGLMLNVETAGCVMLLECIGIGSLLLSSSYYLAPLTPPLLTTPRMVWSSSTAPELEDGWVEMPCWPWLKFKCWRQCWCCGQECGCRSGSCWAQRSRSLRSVKSSHCEQQASPPFSPAAGTEACLPGVYFILMMPLCWDPLSVSAALLNCCSSNDHGKTPDWAWTSWHRTSGNIECKIWIFKNQYPANIFSECKNNKISICHGSK